MNDFTSSGIIFVEILDDNYVIMNFQSLKSMIDSLVKTYKCPECGHDVNESNVDIIWAAGNTINIDVECPSCKKHSMVRTEVLAVDLSNPEVAKWKLELIKWALNEIKRKKQAETKNAIKDKDIIDLNKSLKNENFSASDLFEDE